MNCDYLFEAVPKWERAIDQGLFPSSYSFQIGLFFLLDALAIANTWGRYHFTATGLGILLGFLFILLAAASYLLTGLCRRTRERLRSGLIDAESRRMLLNATWTSYRLYLFILGAPFVILYAILAAHP